MLQWMKLRAKPRDLLFFAIGCVIAYHEVFISESAEPLLIFTVLFLWGLIPAFWGDRAPDQPPAPPAPPPEPPHAPEASPASDSNLTLARAWTPAIA